MMHFAKTLIDRASGRMPSVMPRISQAYEGDGGFVIEDGDGTTAQPTIAEPGSISPARKKEEANPIASVHHVNIPGKTNPEKPDVANEKEIDTNNQLIHNEYIVHNSPVVNTKEIFIDRQIDEHIFQNNDIKETKETKETKEIREIIENNERLLIENQKTSINKVFYKSINHEVLKTGTQPSTEHTSLKPVVQPALSALDNKRSSPDKSTSQTIHVSIGRVEVKVTQQQEVTKNVQGKKSAVMGLDEFLERSEQRRK